MPADQETIRYTGFYGTDRNGKSFLSREVLGGGSGGRYYADGNDAIHIVPNSRNQPAEFTETRFPLLVEKLALRTDSGGAGKRRGGLGYDKHYRALVDCRTIVTADRVRLGCYGLNGGKAGTPFCVTDRCRRARRTNLGGLVDGEPVLAGQVVRVVTTGGGGWGDPLEREPDWVQRDVIEGKVSLAAARDDYGVVLRAADGKDPFVIDEAGDGGAAREAQGRAQERAADDRSRRRLRENDARRGQAVGASSVKTSRNFVMSRALHRGNRQCAAVLHAGCSLSPHAGRGMRRVEPPSDLSISTLAAAAKAGIAATRNNEDFG